MSTSKAPDRLQTHVTLGDLARHFGANEADLAAAGRRLDAFVQDLKSLVVSALPALLTLGEHLDSMSREPETPGHEKLFREQLGQDPLRAKLSTRAVHYLGQILANETRQGRRVRATVAPS